MDAQVSVIGLLLVSFLSVSVLYFWMPVWDTLTTYLGEFLGKVFFGTLLAFPVLFLGSKAAVWKPFNKPPSVIRNLDDLSTSYQDVHVCTFDKAISEGTDIAQFIERKLEGRPQWVHKYREMASQLVRDFSWNDFVNLDDTQPYTDFAGTDTWNSDSGVSEVGHASIKVSKFRRRQSPVQTCYRLQVVFYGVTFTVAADQQLSVVCSGKLKEYLMSQAEQKIVRCRSLAAHLDVDHGQVPGGDNEQIEVSGEDGVQVAPLVHPVQVEAPAGFPVEVVDFVSFYADTEI